MTTTINASPTNGLVQTADGSGVIKLQSNGVTTNALAWVNFDSSSNTSCVVRASYNVSSVTYNGTTSYNVNFANALSDANYCVSYMTGTTQTPYLYNASQAPTTTTCRLALNGATNPVYNMVTVFGN